MKIGGFAHINGVTFFGDTFKVKTILKNNQRKLKINWILTPRWLKRLEKFKLFKFLSILHYQWMVFDIKMKCLILFTILFYSLEGILQIPSTLSTEVNKWYFIIPSIFMVLLFGRKIARLLRYHGAEHKVINCYINHGIITEELVTSSSRFNKRCGTNLVSVFIILYSLMFLLEIDSLLITLLLFVMAIFINRRLIQLKNRKWDKYINFFQRITVWEPRCEEIQTAIIGFNKLYSAHRIYQQEMLKGAK